MPVIYLQMRASQCAVTSIASMARLAHLRCEDHAVSSSRMAEQQRDYIFTGRLQDVMSGPHTRVRVDALASPPAAGGAGAAGQVSPAGKGKKKAGG